MKIGEIELGILKRIKYKKNNEKKNAQLAEKILQELEEKEKQKGKK